MSSIDVILVSLLLPLKTFSTAVDWMSRQLKDCWETNLVCWDTYYNPLHHSHHNNPDDHHICPLFDNTSCSYHMQIHDLHIFSFLRVKRMLLVRVWHLVYIGDTWTQASNKTWYSHRSKWVKSHIDVHVCWTNSIWPGGKNGDKHKLHT